MSTAWHCDYEGCDAWARVGGDGVLDWFVLSCPRAGGRSDWHFCCRDHLMLWDRWVI